MQEVKTVMRDRKMDRQGSVTENRTSGTERCDNIDALNINKIKNIPLALKNYFENFDLIAWRSY
jgi:hypothetical protein